MTSEAQIEANQQNALLSTGPKTETGKAVVATNAIKHGIFTKDLIVSSEIGHENASDYQEMLKNLVDCLLPGNQIEYLLVEKIAVDFWRLRRTIRFETGSIRQGIDVLLKNFYSCGTKDNECIDKEVLYKQQTIAWNTTFLESLRKGEVTFDKPEWLGNQIKSDIIDDLYLLAKSISSLSKAERERLYSFDCLTLDELRSLLDKHGYMEEHTISSKLIELYTKQNQRLETEIHELAQKKEANDAANRLMYMIGMTPATENTDKVLKYDRSLQKSIYQNIIMLKKLQMVSQ